MRIETDVPAMIVEIEDKEYTVAPRTVEICDKLIEAERVCLNKPAYKLWLAELEILLGKAACRELFSAGGQENVDRIQRIYAGVSRAFNYTADQLQTDESERHMRALGDALGPLNELLKNMKALDGKPVGDQRPTIKRA